MYSNTSATAAVASLSDMSSPIEVASGCMLDEDEEIWQSHRRPKEVEDREDDQERLSSLNESQAERALRVGDDIFRHCNHRCRPPRGAVSWRLQSNPTYLREQQCILVIFHLLYHLCYVHMHC